MLSAQLSTYYCSPALRRSCSCGGRNRTYASWFKARHHYQQRRPRNRDSEGRAGLEPAHGCLTGTCSAAELPTQSV